MAEGTKFAENIKSLFFEVSAKTGDNIPAIFNGVVNQLVGTSTPNQQVVIEDENAESNIFEIFFMIRS